MQPQAIQGINRSAAITKNELSYDTLATLESFESKKTTNAVEINATAAVFVPSYPKTDGKPPGKSRSIEPTRRSDSLNIPFYCATVVKKVKEPKAGKDDKDKVPKEDKVRPTEDLKLPRPTSRGSLSERACSPDVEVGVGAFQKMIIFIFILLYYFCFW